MEECERVICYEMVFLVVFCLGLGIKVCLFFDILIFKFVL